MDLDASFLREGIALGIDVIILGFLYKSYESVNSYIEALKVRLEWWKIPFTIQIIVVA